MWFGYKTLGMEVRVLSKDYTYLLVFFFLTVFVYLYMVIEFWQTLLNEDHYMCSCYE